MKVFFHLCVVYETINSIIMKKKTKFNKLDSKRYSILDKSTGELFEPNNSNLYTAADDDGLIFNSKRYFIFDDDRLKCMLSSGIDSNTLGAFIILTQNLKMNYNICMNSDKQPFNAKRLSKEIKKSTQQSRYYIRKLIKHKIIRECILKSRKDLKKVLVLNPFLARKGKLMDDSLRGLFDDFCD
jgi:hypothetical protein|tara:strand:- start:94 stop:645 length:552 start_codon:yes stop_codon:yes gene_type:complete